MPKFKPMLFQQLEQQKAEQKKQEELHEKYDIEAKDTVVVEKSNMFKWSVRTMGAVIRLMATILLCVLASIGLTAIVYEATREELLRVLAETMQNLQVMLGI